MNTTSRSAQASSRRLRIGAAALAAAEVVDTKLVAARVSAFAEAHRGYVDAGRRVDEAKARLDAERLKLAQLGAEHDEAVEKLACCLVNDGQPRSNPFEAFDADSPGNIKRMAPAEAARAVRALLAALARSSQISATTREAAERVEQVTQQVEAALAPVKTLRNEMRATPGWRRG